MAVCGLSCGRSDSPQTSFQNAQQTLRHGDLIRAQDEAERGYHRFSASSPAWAIKFRNLEAEALLLRGRYPQVLDLLGSGPDSTDAKDSVIETLTLRGAARARLHYFDDAEQDIRRAAELCRTAPELTCAGVFRARGVLAVQHNQPDRAKDFFEQNLYFARAHGDPFLEATALLNLGQVSLLQQHFDEAIDWTNAAYRTAEALDAGTIATKALGNLGWAYYNLGDTEKSLDFSLEAERRAIKVGDVIDQLSWLTNVGYVYQQAHDIPRAKHSYSKALDLAKEINGREDIYNALRALALVSVQSGELEQARSYADEAILIAQKDNNRLDELYPLLVKGLIAARENHGTEAERIFREVEQDKSSNSSLRWRAEHALARLYEDQKHSALADGEYRTALDTFEAARSSLKRSESKLPFSTNAVRIYDDYIHFLVMHGKADEALRWADYGRARMLSEGLGLLSNRGLTAASADSPALKAQEISQHAKGTILFYWLGESQSYLWAITPRKTGLFPLPPSGEIDSLVERYRKALNGPEDVLATSGEARQLYRILIAPAQTLLARGAKVFIIPDGSLNNLNFETLVVADAKLSGAAMLSEPKLSRTELTDPKLTGQRLTKANLNDPKLIESQSHFWIEDADVVNASSLRVLAATFSQDRIRQPKSARKLLLMGDSVAPSKDYPQLPGAAEQMASVARHFAASQKQIFQHNLATPAAYLGSHPEQFSHIHFVAHGTASRLSPLDSAIVLSPGANDPDSFKLYARDIIGHQLRADLVTISACYGAGERSYSGEGLVGLAWAFLRAGAHNVIAGLWEVTDASTAQLMDRFYDELDKGLTPDAALRAAKLSLLHASAFRNPFYWAPFQLYTGS